MELSTRHFVRPEDLNHHETLYAGRISEWITEAAMIGVTRLLGSNEGVVLVALNNISIQKPTVAGAILDFYMEKGTPPLHQYSHLYYGKTYADRPGTCQRNRHFRYRG